MASINDAAVRVASGVSEDPLPYPRFPSGTSFRFLLIRDHGFGTKNHTVSKKLHLTRLTVINRESKNGPEEVDFPCTPVETGEPGWMSFDSSQFRPYFFLSPP